MQRRHRNDIPPKAENAGISLSFYRGSCKMIYFYSLYYFSMVKCSFSSSFA
jgi:hypothetical protein